MDSQLKKKLDAVKPTRANKKRTYDQPLRVLQRGADRSPEGHWNKVRRTSEASELFFSIRWDEAWWQFLERESDGKFKYKTARDVVGALAVGIDAKTRRRRARCLYSAIGPVSAVDKNKEVPYLGDWEMLRAQTFIGEMKKDSLLFGSPRMKTMREAMRKHVDVMEVAKACAETMLTWVARYEAWAREVDEHYGYKLFDPKLSDKQNLQRFKRYTELQRSLHAWQAEAVEHVLRCYGVGKDDVSVLMQLMVAGMAQQLGERTTQTILAGLSGVEGVFDGRAAGGAGEQSGEDPYSNKTLRLIMASFLEKAVLYKMPHPDVHIPGVPDEDDQETPRERAKRKGGGPLPDIPDRKRIQ
jgi:hypothetical protein